MMNATIRSSVALSVAFAAFGLLAAERFSGRPGARFALSQARCTGQWNCVVDPGPRMSYTTGDAMPNEKTGLWNFSFGESANGVTPGINGTLRTTFRSDGKVACDYTLTATKPEPVRDFYFSLSLPNQHYAGGRIVADGREFPLAVEWESGKTPGRPVVGSFVRTDVYDRKGILCLSLEFPVPTQVSLCDSRSWGSSGFDLRLPLGALATFVKGETRTYSFVLSAPGGLKDSFVKRVVESGKDWTPFRFDKEVLADSACDFSSQLPLDAPAGKHGWIVAKGEDFEFENLPGVRQRFYGNNISWSVPQSTRERSAKLAREFVRSGYNAMRLHYWDIMMTDGVPDGTTIPEERLRAFDGFMKEIIDAGIYVTTDLYTSRRVPYRTIGIDRKGFVPMDEFKERLLVCEAAVKNLEDYVRQLLTHRNVHTGRDYAHEPALAWYCIVNEGNPGNFGFTYAKDIPEFRTEWKEWLKGKKAADPASADIPEDFPKSASSLDRHGAAYRQFLAFLARRLDTRMKTFVRSLGSKALVTSMNAWNNPMSYQLVREDVYDFVDDHFYIDHPRFSNGRAYPTTCAGLNPVADGCAGVPGVVSRRLLSKPFTVTEYNYSWPGRFRGTGGLLMGAFASLQNWSALWRFCFGKDGAIIDDPNVALLRFHDTWADPMMRASEYPFAALFLRGDLKPLAARTPVTLARKDVERLHVEPVASSRFPWSRLAWYSRVGTLVDAPSASSDFHPRAYPAAYAADTFGKVRTELFSGSSEDEPLPPTADGAVRFDEEKGTLAVATEKTCGVFLEHGSLNAGALTASVDSPATVWAVSRDGKPLVASRRILVGHQTDALQAGTTFMGEDATCLMAHGRAGELLIRNGTATVALTLPTGDYRVYALSSGGRRLAEIATQRNDAGQLVFEANVVRDPKMATYLYEVVR